MKRILFTLMIMSFTMLILGCGSNKDQDVEPDGQLVYRPAWWGTQEEDGFVCTYGQGTNLAENSSMNSARANALQEAAQYVEMVVQGMIKDYEEEAGVNDPTVLSLTSSVVRAVANAKFSGVITGKVETRKVQEHGGTRYKTWIQLKIPRDEVNKNLMNTIRNEESLYNQFKASQSFKELDEQLEKY
ncbi:MAG: hypothetical protein PWP64_1383 [Candidatus Cloacimonadota bacterium]|nr:hypothetical protein [Candidatus Cloacimonadota bacterium]